MKESDGDVDGDGDGDGGGGGDGDILSVFFAKWLRWLQIVVIFLSMLLIFSKSSTKKVMYIYLTNPMALPGADQPPKHCAQPKKLYLAQSYTCSGHSNPRYIFVTAAA